MEVFDRGKSRTYYTRPMPHPQDPNAATTTVEVDALALAHGAPPEGKKVWEVEFRTRRFPRLNGIAASDVPTVAVRLVFSLLDGKPVVHGVIRGSVELLCQRCLQHMQHGIEESFDLMLVDDEVQLDLAPESYEAWLTNAGRLDVAALVEEQLLLAMPLIAKHEDDSECIAVASAPTNKPLGRRVEREQQPQAAATDTQRPFANLRDLLSK